jgi:hypothetical protein
MTDTPDGLTVTYEETDAERRLVYEREGMRVIIAQNTEGYAMLKVRSNGDERERYYGFDMALDHVGELLGVPPNRLPVPDAAADMGM